MYRGLISNSFISNSLISNSLHDDDNDDDDDGDDDDGDDSGAVCALGDTSAQYETLLSTMWDWDQSFIDACTDE